MSRGAGTDGRPTSRWGWVAAVAVVSVLGFAGWLRSGASLLDALYQTIQLFTLDYPSGMPPDLLLDVARFGAVATTATAVFALAGTFLRARAARRALARLSGHTIVVGAGDVGGSILRALRGRDPDEALVAVDLDPRSLSRVAHLDVHTVEGDGQDPAILAAARIDRARRVIVATGAWGVTADVSTRVAHMVPPDALALAHVDDPRLCHVLRRQHLLDLSGSTDVFNLQEHVAHAVLGPWDDRLAGAADGPSRIVVLGGRHMGEALVVQACLRWLASPRPFPLRLEVVSERDDPVADIVARWPELARTLATVRHVDASPGAYAADAPVHLDTRYVVDLPTDGIGLAVGTTLTERDPALDCVVLPSPGSDLGPDRLPNSNLASLAWGGQGLDTDSLWLLARSLHEVYRQQSIAASSAHAGAWDSLPPHIQQDNRDAVRFMLEQLPAHDLSLVPVRAPDPSRPPPGLTDIVGMARAESLAAAEHDRWRRSRASSSEPPRRFATSWEDLDPEARDASLATVNRWPLVLLRVGYELADRRDSELDRLLRRGGTWERRGLVTARRTDERVTWTTDNGDELTAEAGDWLVEQDGARWSVAPTAFRQAYTRTEGDSYRRAGRVRAVRLRESVEVATEEGPATGNPGDWLVQNELFHVWPVPDDHFRANYRPAVGTDATDATRDDQAVE